MIYYSNSFGLNCFYNFDFDCMMNFLNCPYNSICSESLNKNDFYSSCNYIYLNLIFSNYFDIGFSDYFIYKICFVNNFVIFCCPGIFREN